METASFLVAGEQRLADDAYRVLSPYDQSLVSEVSRPGGTELEQALDRAGHGFRRLAELDADRRGELLGECSRRMAAAREEFAQRITAESGKPIVQARVEVERAIQTLRISGEEARRIGGEVIPLDAVPGNRGRLGLTRRFPVGPVACITPFNFPLNLVAHKIAPAIAAGCPFVLKPASQTPLSALALARLMLEVGVPAEAVSVLPLRAADAGPLIEDSRVRAVSFTGSPEVGWDLRRRAFRKKVVLELGGNAGLIVDATADVERAVERTAAGAFGYSGQSCISVQRVFVQATVHDRFLDGLVRRAERLRVGDPRAEDTDVGPVISDADADRIEAWLAEAVESGAEIRSGGQRDGRLIRPTVLTGTRPEMKVCSREVFAPVVVVERFHDVAEAIAAVDDSDYGLQAGVFSRDLRTVMAAHAGIEVGAVVVNDVPTFRADHMPYGGVKQSGIGREGPRYAIEDYTEPRLLVLDLT